MNTITTAEFLRRYASNTGLSLKEVRPILAMVEDEITKSLVSSRDVRLAGLGTFKKVKFRSQMMANPNNRRQRRLVLDRYYMRFKASNILKDRIKKSFRPDYQPKTKTAREAPAERLTDEVRIPTRYSRSKPVDGRSAAAERGSIPIRVSVKPRIPPIHWREPMSALYLDLSKKHIASADRLVKNIIRWMALDQTHGLSIAPHQMIVYEEKKRITSLQPILYDSFVKVFAKHLPQILRSPQTWRLMINLPPKIIVNLSVAPVAGRKWSFHLQKPYISSFRQPHNVSFPVLVNKKLDAIFDRGYGRVAIVGPRASRLAVIEHIREILDHESIGYHYTVEHHHHCEHPYHILEPHLVSIWQEAATHPVLIVEHLSGADNLDHLRRNGKIVVAGIVPRSYGQLKLLLERQGLEPAFFDLVLEAHTLPLACNCCPPVTRPAVLFPSLRKIAAAYNDRLDATPVFLSYNDCDHEMDSKNIIVAYGAGGTIGQNLKEQLYHLVLGQKITYDIFNQELTGS